MVLDVFIVWLILYYVLRLVRSNSRTIQIFKGILLVIIVDALSKLLGLKTVEYFADMFINWGFLALIIIFQPELRSILEKLGKTNVFSRMTSLTGNEKENLVNQIVTAIMLLSKDKTGALISIERTQSMDEFVATGTRLNSDVTAEILTSIFVTTTPLHDGAVIIQGDKISCASAYFPPTNLELPGKYGARHRAAVGISEITDAVTIVVSEESGNVSITEGGRMIHVNEKELRDYLIRAIVGESVEVDMSNRRKKDREDRREGLMSKLAIRKQEEEEIDELEELHRDADRIKLPQNHKHDRPVPSYPEQKERVIAGMHEKISPVEVTSSQEIQEPVKRMSTEEVEQARKANLERLKKAGKNNTSSVDSSRSVVEELLPDTKEEEEKFNTSNLDISKIVGFDSELNETFDMVDQLPKTSGKNYEGGDNDD